MKQSKLEEAVTLAIMNKDELGFIESICSTYHIKYDEKLLDQVFDRYNSLVPREGYYKAKLLTLYNFYNNVIEQVTMRYNNE